MSKVLINGKSVTVTTSGEVRWNPEAGAIDLIVARAIGLIRKRTNDGIDIDGKPFAPYSPDYAAQKAEAGRGTNVNLTVTQTLLRSVAERTRKILGANAEVVIGPGTGAHPVYSLTPKGKKSRSPATASPTNAIGYWLHKGTPRMRARPWLGLAPKDVSALAKLIRSLTPRLFRR